jgi:hypothetical protein
MNNLFFVPAILSVLTFAASSVVRADAASHPREAEKLAKLDDTLKVRCRAESFDSLVRLTRPRLTWRGHDMLWVTQDAAGRVGFVMDRAYDLGQPGPVFCLLEADGYCWPDAQQGAFRYTRATDTAPIIVARDPKHGVVYHARWQSAPQTGSGRMIDTRHVFLLCDELHRWHLLGDGPITSEGANGADEVDEQTIETMATWTAVPEHPVDLAFTLLATKQWGLSGDGQNNPHHPSLTIRWDMVPGKSDTGGLADGIDAEDAPPGPFAAKQPPYIVASQSESLDGLARRIAHCSTGFPVNGDDHAKRRYMDQLEVSLRQLNPALGRRITAGERIVLSEQMHLMLKP